MAGKHCLRCRHRLACLEAARGAIFCDTCREALQIAKRREAVVAVDEEPPPEPGPAPGRSFSTRADLEAAAGISPVSDASGASEDDLGLLGRFARDRSAIAQGSPGDPLRIS